jgi:hypothetical protein
MSDTDADWPSQDVVFDILSNRRRRYILSSLYQRDDPITLMDFANEIAAWENGVPPDEVTSDQQKRVYVSVYQTHVPKLQDAGVITYESDSGLIELTERAEDLVQYLPVERRDEPPWQLLYVGVTLVGLAVHLLGVFGVFPVAVGGFVVVLGVLAVAIAQFAYERLNGRRERLNLIERRDEIFEQ